MGELKKVFRPGVPQPHRRRDRLPQAAEGGDQADRRAAAAAHPRVDGRARAAARADRARPRTCSSRRAGTRRWARARCAARSSATSRTRSPTSCCASSSMPGATVVVDPAPEGEEGEVRLTIVKPKKQKTPVGVGAEGAAPRSSPRARRGPPRGRATGDRRARRAVGGRGGPGGPPAERGKRAGCRSEHAGADDRLRDLSRGLARGDEHLRRGIEERVGKN